jgi:hypothetical protein
MYTMHTLQNIKLCISILLFQCMYMHVPEILNMILFELVVDTLVHVTVEARSATIRNLDTSTGTPLMLVLFVNIAVIFRLITLVMLFARGISCVVNRRASPCPMYSVLLQARIKVATSVEPLIVQVKMTSLPRQA